MSRVRLRCCAGGFGNRHDQSVLRNRRAQVVSPQGLGLRRRTGGESPLWGRAEQGGFSAAERACPPKAVTPSDFVTALQDAEASREAPYRAIRSP